MDSQIFDVAIIGGGPVGASLALGLANAGLQTCLVDARTDADRAKHDGRNFAIVSGSWHLLQTIGVSEPLTEISQPLHGLEAVDGGTHWFGQPSVLFTDADLDSADPEETLGYMVRAEALQSALDAAIKTNKNLKLLAPAQFAGLEQTPGAIKVSLKSGDQIKARLLIGADGMRSPVRQALNIHTEGRDYFKSVFTANVKLEQPHNGIARQLFTPEGPFATLPLTGQRANLAWYMKRGAAEALSAMPIKDAEAELNARFADFSGPMQIEGETGSYPLILQLATEITAERAALVGDAARRVNPLAGQGLNQGFRDVAAMIEALSAAQHTGLDIGSAPVLERYSQARRFDATATSLVLDGIDRLFSNDAILTKPIRSIGLLAASKISPLRRFMARKSSAAEDGVPGPMKVL